MSRLASSAARWRHTFRHTLGGSTLLIAVAAAAALLAGCGGGGANVAPGPQPQPQRSESALNASAPGELLDYVKGKLKARDEQRRTGVIFEDGAAPPWLATFTTTSGTAERSGTTVQEAGVDEDDLIKSDSSAIYTLQPNRGGDGKFFASLQAWRLDTSGTPQRAGSVDLAAPDDLYAVTHGMYLAADARRVAVIAESSGGVIGLPFCPDQGIACTSLLPFPGSFKSQVQLQVVDVSDLSRTTVRDKVSIDGRLVGSRQLGNMLYMVTANSPQFAYERLPTTATPAERDAALARLASGDFLPKWQLNGGAARPLVADTDCYVQPKNASLDLTVTTITAINLAAGTVAPASRCFVGGSDALYMSPDSIYLATSRYPVQTLRNTLRFAPDARTDIHKFAVNGAQISYRGSGDVNGHLGWDREKSPYRMSEHNGDLRVLTFTGQGGWVTLADAGNPAQAPSPASLSILRERASDQTLQVVSTLPNAQRSAAIGKPGEQVYAVRFLGDRAYVVTFRQVDPLYVLDLSNPADPRTAGELTVPGFSDYLFPLANGMLFGVGKDASDEGRLGGVKVALFDVRNAAQPRQLASQTLGERGSHSGLDMSRHALNMLTVGNSARIALPVNLASSTARTMQQGLQRFDVDTAAGTIAVKPLIEGNKGSLGYIDISTERSLQIGGKLYYLSQGRLTVQDW